MHPTDACGSTAKAIAPSRKREIVRCRDLLSVLALESHVIRTRDLAAELSRSPDHVSGAVGRARARRVQDEKSGQKLEEQTSVQVCTWHPHSATTSRAWPGSWMAPFHVPSKAAAPAPRADTENSRTLNSAMIAEFQRRAMTA